MDEEIAIGAMMVGMAEWIHENEKAPYPLREACQDHLVSLAIEESALRGIAITTERESWAI